MEKFSPKNKENNWRDSKEILSFEDFTKRYGEGNFPTYNNFLLFFTDNEGYVNKRESSLSFQKFKSENEELEKELTEKISSILKTRDPNRPRAMLLKEIEPKLYEAYKIMIGYDETENNWSLAA